MKVLILNSGIGHRMGDLTKSHPKCMTNIYNDETILSRQLKLLKKYNLNDIIITTGYYDNVLIDYVNSLNLDLNIKYIKNNRYKDTNYIYSVYCANEEIKNEDIIFMHGDLVFDEIVLDKAISSKDSVMVVSSTLPLPDKDFKAVIKDNRIIKIGIDFFDDALEAQPLYKLNNKDLNIWLNKITDYIKDNKTNVYAENAFNEVSDKCLVKPLDVKDLLCAEIDTMEDLDYVKKRIK